MAGVTIQELGLRFVDACMRLYWGSCWYPLLFAVGLICTLVLGEKKKVRDIYRLYSISAADSI